MKSDLKSKVIWPHRWFVGSFKDGMEDWGNAGPCLTISDLVDWLETTLSVPRKIDATTLQLLRELRAILDEPADQG